MEKLSEITIIVSAATVLLFVSSTPYVYAETQVTTSINSSIKQTTSSSYHTTIRIETNGTVKTYESDKPGSVHLESDDGSSKVDVNTSVIQPDVTSLSTPPVSPATVSPTSSVQKNGNTDRVKTQKSAVTATAIAEEIRSWIRKFILQFFPK